MKLNEMHPVRFKGGPLDGGDGTISAKVTKNSVLLPMSVAMEINGRTVEYRLTSREMPKPVYTYVPARA